MNSFWETVVTSFKSITINWNATPYVEPKVDRASKRIKISNDKYSEIRCEENCVVLETCEKSADVGRKRNASCNQSSHTADPMDELASSFEKSVRVQSKSDGKADRQKKTLEAQELNQNTESSYLSMKAEIERLLESLIQYDPVNHCIAETNELLMRANRAMYTRINASHTSRSAGRNTPKSRSEKSVNEILWKARLRSENVRNTLNDAMRLLVPAVAEVERRRLLINDIQLTQNILSFLATNELSQSLSVCVHWKDAIQRKKMILTCIQTTCERWTLWKFHINRRAMTKKKEIYSSYSSLLKFAEDSPEVDHNLIERDVCRTTFIRHTDIYSKPCLKRDHVYKSRIGSSREMSFSDKENVIEYQNKLQRILKAYAIYDRSVGYCQGMTYLGSLILSCLCFDEEKTFHVFTALMDRYEMDEIFRRGLPGTNLRCYQLQRLLKYHMPDVFLTMDRYSIHPIMFASGWIMTLFSNECELDPKVSVMILDSFMIGDWTAMFQLYLGLLSFNKGTIMGEKMEKVLQELTRMAKSMAAENIERIFFKAMKFNVSQDQLKQLEFEHR